MIKNVLLCGLGAVGSIYANKIKDYADLRILVDEDRLERYRKNPLILNGKILELNYILPDEQNFKADLIVITTKYDGLSDAVNSIKNFVKSDSIIISLLNGINSEKIIAKKYGQNKVLLSYWIGHSAMRTGNKVSHDGIGTIVFGSKKSNNENVAKLKEFFDYAKIEYKLPEDIEYNLWLKFMLNVSSNQPSAVYNATFGELINNPEYMDLIKKLMIEVQVIAKAEGVKNTGNMIDDALNTLSKMCPEGKTSMLQDVLAKRKTEVDMFAGTIIELGKKHNIPTPYNEMMKEKIELIHQNY